MSTSTSSSFLAKRVPVGLWICFFVLLGVIRIATLPQGTNAAYVVGGLVGCLLVAGVAAAVVAAIWRGLRGVVARH